MKSPKPPKPKKPPKPPTPVEGAKLTWRCREVVNRLAIWSLAFGACAIVVILAISIPRAVDDIPRHALWEDTYFVFGVFLGLPIAILCIVCGLIGGTDFPRLDRLNGILFVGSDHYPTAWRLADLGDITVEQTTSPKDGRNDAHGGYLTGYLVWSSTVGELAEFPGSLGRGDPDRLAAALRALVAARTLPPP